MRDNYYVVRLGNWWLLRDLLVCNEVTLTRHVHEAKRFLSCGDAETVADTLGGTVYMDKGDLSCLQEATA